MDKKCALVLIPVVLAALSCGCSAPRFSMYGGTAKLSVPFEFASSQKENSAAIYSSYKRMTREELAKAGYSKSLEKSYFKKGSEEWITFFDFSTEDPSDTITFHLTGGRVDSSEHSSQP